MRIKSQIGKSIANQLADIINKALPRVIDTGINSHLTGVKPDPKGKAILFAWKKEGFRMTENLKVSKKDDFGNGFMVRDECKEIEKMIEASLNSVVSEVAPTKEEVTTEVTPTPEETIVS